MELNVAIRLIRKGVRENTVQTWADLGCGKGLFTQALATLLFSNESKIYAIDQDGSALQSVEGKVKNVSIEKVRKNFIHDALSLTSLDGILMANSFHFVQQKEVFTRKIQKSLRSSGRILLVEYDTDHPNRWVPYPISFNSLIQFADKTGFSKVMKLDEEPSMYGGGKMYSALLEL